MPKKKVDWNKKKASGLTVKQADPTRRLRSGRSSIVDFEELSSLRASRQHPKKWRELTGFIESGAYSGLDDVIVAGTLGGLRDLSYESLDEIAGAVWALNPLQKNAGSYRKSRDAIRNLLDAYEHEYPVATGAGRAISLIAGIVKKVPTLGMYIVTMLGRVGLKGTEKTIRVLDKIVEKNPQLLKLKPKEFINKVGSIANKGKKIAKEPTTIYIDGVAHSTGVSHKEGFDALKEGATDPFNIAMPFVPAIGRKALEVGKKVAKIPNRVIDYLYSDFGPKQARKMAKRSGFSDEAIKFLDEHKYLISPGKHGGVDSKTDTMELMREFIEQSYGHSKNILSRALSELDNNKPKVLVKEVEDIVDDAILSIFKAKGYRPKGKERELYNPLSVTDEEYSHLKGKLKGPTYESVELPPVTPKTQGRPDLGPSLTQKKKAESDFTFLPDEDVPGEFTFVSKKSPKAKAAKVDDSLPPVIKGKKKGKAIDLYDDPSIVGERAGADSIDSLKKNTVLRRFSKNETLNDLLALKQELRTLRDEGVAMTEGQLYSFVQGAKGKSRYNNQSGKIENPLDLSQYKGIHGKLYGRLRRKLGSVNKKYDLKTKQAHDVIDLLEHPEMGGKEMAKEVGISVTPVYRENELGVEVVDYVVRIDDPPVFYNWIREGVSADRMDLPNKYRDSFRNLLNKGTLAAETDIKAGGPLVRKDFTTLTDQYFERDKGRRTYKNPNTGEEFVGQRTPVPILKDQFYDKIKKDILAQSFDSPEEATGMFNMLERKFFGDKIPTSKNPDAPGMATRTIDVAGKVLRTAGGKAVPIAGWGATGAGALGLTSHFISELRGGKKEDGGDFPIWAPALTAAYPIVLLAARQKFKTGKDYVNIQKWLRRKRNEFRRNPLDVLKKIGVDEELTDHIMSLVPAEARQIERFSKTGRGMLGDKNTPEAIQAREKRSGDDPPVRDPQSQEVEVEEYEDSWQPEARGILPPRGNIESEIPTIPFRPEEDSFIEEDFEIEDVIEDPEVADRELRKDRIRSFLKQQESGRRRKRRLS